MQQYLIALLICIVLVMNGVGFHVLIGLLHIHFYYDVTAPTICLCSLSANNFLTDL